MDTVKAAFTSYLSHLAAYVISGVTIVSTLAPGTLPPKYAFLTAIATAMAAAFSHGKAVTANAGSIVGAIASAATDAVNAAAAATPAVVVAAPAAIVKAVAPVLLALMILPGLALLHGCASTSALVTAPASQSYVTDAANTAVLIAESQGITAAQINAVAVKALAADSGTSATLASVSAVLNAQLAKLNLSPIEALAVSALESGLTAGINAQLSNNPTVTQAQAAIADVLNAVIKATTPTS